MKLTRGLFLVNLSLIFGVGITCGLFFQHQQHMMVIKKQPRQSPIDTI